MERNNSLSKTLKDHSTAHSHLHHPRLCSPRNPLDHYGSSQTYGRSEENYLCGISWPPRSYSCSFCKREFRSAQALGGHMNVHRRDRARLRQSSPVEDFPHYPFLTLSTNPCPSLNPNSNPNPNPSDTSSASPSLFTANCSSISHSQASPSLFPAHLPSASSSLEEMKAVDQSLLGTLRSRATESKPKTMSEGPIRVQEMVESYKYFYTDTEMDLLGGSNDDYIDLELRLGCP